MTLPDDPDVLRIVRDELRAQVEHLGDEGNYAEARRFQAAHAIVTERLHQEDALAVQVGAVRELSGRHQQLEQLVTKYVDDWARDFDEFRRNAEENAEELRQAHEEEIEAFDAASPIDFDGAVAKRSPRLLQLRHREAKLALTRRYEEAECLREQANDREDDEAAVATERQRTAHVARREKLLAAQDRDVQSFADRAETTRQIMVTQRDRKIAGYLRRMNTISRELGNRLAVLHADEADVCDQEPDEARAEFAYREEMALPVKTFRRGATADRIGRPPLPPRPGLTPRHH
jgi:hypothetical protein